MKGSSPWEQGGVKAVELCKDLHEHLTEAQSVGSNADPILQKMIDFTSVHKEFDERCSEIQSFQSEIEDVSAILVKPEKFEDLTREQQEKIVDDKKELLASKKGEFYSKSLKTSTESELSKEIMNNFFKVTNSFGPYLFTFFDVPNLPSTNNGTEQFFGRIRTKLRRITGRQNNHSLISTRGDYIALTLSMESYEAIKERISGVSYDDYAKEKKRYEKQNVNTTIRFRIKKDSPGFLNKLTEGWKVLIQGTTNI